MKSIKALLLILIVSILFSACENNEVEKIQSASDSDTSNAGKQVENFQMLKVLNLESEVLDRKNETTDF